MSRTISVTLGAKSDPLDMYEHIKGFPGVVDYAQIVTETQINSSVAYFSLLVNYRLLAMFWTPTLTAWNSGDTQP